MCGIAGFIGTRLPDENRQQACIDVMQRRGPDATGIWQHVLPNGRQVLFLHSRLSILDMDDAANQPLKSPASVMAVNGELYNYRELAEDLKASGQAAGLRPSSDSMVLQYILNQRGIAGLDQCEGMWAFAHYDRRTHQVSLCRDRFAEKPLFWLRRPEGIYFGSEIKFLVRLAGYAPDLNRQQLSRYLVNGYKSLYKQGSPAFYQEIEEVPAGHVLQIAADGEITRASYWSWSLPKQDLSMTRHDAIAGVQAELERSVSWRLRADVPLAFCLSGGIDSNVLMGIAIHLGAEPVEAFSIMNQDARYEEADLIHEVVDHFGVRHHKVVPKADNFLNQLETLIQYHDAPVYTLTWFAHWQLMQSISDAGFRVSITGTGADELFSGYYDHHMAYLQGLHSHADPNIRALEPQARFNWQEKILPIVRNPYLQDPDYLINNPSSRKHIYLDNHVFAEFMQDDWFEDFIEESYHPALLRNRMMNELFHESVPVILHEDDLNAMYYSVENRSPFLDRGLFDFMNRVPDHLLVHNGCAKALLREAGLKYSLPSVMNNPRKVGFNAPIHDYLDVQEAAVRDRLLDDSSPVWDVMKRPAIEDLLTKTELANSRSKFLFNFVNAKLFMENMDHALV